MEDPQQRFTILLVKALISILPAVGFFKKHILKEAKIEWRVCSHKERKRASYPLST